jgi:hypothetical protein
LSGRRRCVDWIGLVSVPYFALPSPTATLAALRFFRREAAAHRQRQSFAHLTTMLNRSVLIVRPRQPMVDWVAGLDESGLASNVEGGQTAYLVPEFDDDDEAQQVLEDVFAEVFERELFGWRTDEATWPANRDLALFMQWFEIELHSVVEDLCDFELTDDED